MPRRRVAKKREIQPDAVYQSRLVAKFINCMTWDGKKSTAAKQFYKAMEEIAKKVPQSPMAVFRQAVENAKPLVETKSRRVGGANYQVPVEVRPERRSALATRWLINFARARKGKAFYLRLADEILDAANNNPQCGTIKKKEETHRMAEANKAFAHYRW
ncbi:MAG: 30S ribosomal protein S7 [Candidatus Hydrogenedentota bacterium]|nr:MAG: 30S ribosomal protein S7 [Candidatus Hydrogenedentota bacterium]